MGKIQLFTKEQQLIIDQVGKSDYLSSRFYFTGGTALSYFYIQHRFSEDLDFFSEEKLDTQNILSFIEQWAKKDNFTFTSQLKEVVYIFNLTFPNKVNLKVDFGYYPYKRIEKGAMYQRLSVDSLLDIATNKLTAINQRRQVRDFVDLYFLLKDNFTIWDLIEGARVKFNMEIEPFILGADLFEVDQFNFLPRMIKPLTLEELKLFFRNKAKELASKVVEE